MKFFLFITSLIRKTLRRFSIVFVGWILIMHNAVGAAIPANRLPPSNWQPGVPGGIPTNYKQFCNVRVSIPGTTLRAVGDGVADDYPAIQAAVNACPDNQYIYIPTGTYRLSSPLARSGINRYDGVMHPYSIVIRGDGPTKTKLICYGGGGIVFTHGGGYVGNWPITSGNKRGSTSITCAGGFNYISVGQWVLILRDDTEAGVYHPPAGDPNPFYYTYANCASQFVKVTAIKGTTLTFSPALNEGYPSDKLCIYASQPTRCGIENLYVENKTDASAHNIRIIGGQECWVKNVESNIAKQYHISIEACAGCEVRESYVHDTHDGGGGSDYGICLGFFSSSCLVENNIALHSRHAFILETAAGQNNVIAYNYSKDPINEGLLSTDYLMGDLTTHGGEPRYNLFEGNVASIVRFDTVEGGTKWNTVFRNQLTRSGLPSTYVALQALDIQRGNYLNNFVGNVYQALPSGLPPGYDTQPVYRLGTVQDNAATPQEVAAVTTNSATANYWHGNKNLADGTVTWDSGNSDHALPSSFYLSAKPTWWDGGAWPAIGSDLTAPNGGNPAFRRWQIMQGVTPPSAPQNLRIQN